MWIHEEMDPKHSFHLGASQCLIKMESQHGKGISNTLTHWPGNADFRNVDETSSRCHTKDALSGSMDTDKTASNTEFVFGKIAVYLCALVNYSLAVSLPLGLSVMFLDWQEEFGVTRAQTVAVTSTATGILFGGALLPGYLMSRWGPRVTVLVGSSLCSFACLASYFATCITFLLITAGVLGGLGFCFLQLPQLPAVIEAIHPKYHSIAMTWCSCGINLCSMGLPFLYRYLINRYSWRGSFVFISGICLQTFVCDLVMTSYLKRSLSTKHSPSIETGKTVLDLSTTKQKTSAEDCAKGGHGETEINNDGEFLSLGDEVADGGPSDVPTHHRKINLTQDTEPNGTKGAICPRMRNAINHIRNSKWKFLIDYMFILLLSNMCTCTSYHVAFTLVMMDFARAKGFPGDSTGSHFLLIVFVSNLIGRLTIGPLSFIPHLHSIQLLGIFGMISSFGMIMLGYETNFTRIIIFLAIHGYGAGGVLALNAKCTLDLDSVNEIVYPLALGVTCSIEGICTLVTPMLLGYAVDRTDSYTKILPLLGSVSLACASAIVVAKTHVQYKSHRKFKLKT